MASAVGNLFRKCQFEHGSLKAQFPRIRKLARNFQEIQGEFEQILEGVVGACFLFKLFSDDQFFLFQCRDALFVGRNDGRV